MSGNSNGSNEVIGFFVVIIAPLIISFCLKKLFLRFSKKSSSKFMKFIWAFVGHVLGLPVTILGILLSPFKLAFRSGGYSNYSGPDRNNQDYQRGGSPSDIVSFSGTTIPIQSGEVEKVSFYDLSKKRTFRAVVNLPGGGAEYVTIQASTSDNAIALLERQYGRGNFQYNGEA